MKITRESVNQEIQKFIQDVLDSGGTLEDAKAELELCLKEAKQYYAEKHKK